MPSSTRTATPGPSTTSGNSKRPISDAEPTPNPTKRSRRDSTTGSDPHNKRDSNRDSKRRKRRKRKAPIVGLGVTKDEATLSRSDERSRAPLSARNEIIRFSSAAPEPNPSASVSQSAHTLTRDVSSKPPSGSGETSSRTLDDTTEDQVSHEPMPAALKEKKRAIPPADKPVPESSYNPLEEKVAQLTAELKSKNDLIASHQALVNQVQQAATCQICLDLMYKPYALAPCGHLACYDCLVQWFTAPPPDNRPVPPPMLRRKTCPHCRAVVRERPVEVWGVKGIAQALSKSGLVSIQVPAPVDAPENLNANADPWKDLFRKAGRGGYNGFPWFLPGADIDDDEDEDDIHVADIARRGDDVGMLDMEDGGIYRCLDCMHEIWDGVCSSCGRVYPGHRQEEDDEDDDDDGNAFGWLDEQMVAEEVDIADDPGWVGLEDGEADDDGDVDEWPFDPWRRQFHMFRGPFGFLGAIHIDEEDDEDDEDEEDDGEHVARFLDDEAQESEDDGYDSSFIDDEDDGAGAGDIELGRPRIYEIADDEEEEEEEDPGDLRQQIVDLTEGDHADADVDADADDDEHEHGGYDAPVHRRAGRGFATIIVSSEEDEGEDVDGSERALSPPPRRSRGRRVIEIIESDGSDD